MTDQSLIVRKENFTRINDDVSSKMKAKIETITHNSLSAILFGSETGRSAQLKKWENWDKDPWNIYEINTGVVLGYISEISLQILKEENFPTWFTLNFKITSNGWHMTQPLKLELSLYNYDGDIISLPDVMRDISISSFPCAADNSPKTYIGDIADHIFDYADTAELYRPASTWYKCK